MSQRKIYLIASRLNGEEFLIVKDDHRKIDPFVYITLKAAKDVFDELYKAYHNLPASNSPARMQLLLFAAIFYPVIIAINEKEAVNTIARWQVNHKLFASEQKFLSDPHLYAPMKRGFIHKFQELDIVKDIESITSVGPDGNIIIQEFRINHTFKDEPTEIKPLTEEDFKKILRKRGLM